MRLLRQPPSLPSTEERLAEAVEEAVEVAAEDVEEVVDMLAAGNEGYGTRRRGSASRLVQRASKVEMRAASAAARLICQSMATHHGDYKM